METATIRLMVKAEAAGKTILVLEKVPLGITVGELLARILQSLPLSGAVEDWSPTFNGKLLALVDQVGSCLPMTGEFIEVVLTRRFEASDFDLSLNEEDSSSQLVALEDEETDDEAATVPRAAVAEGEDEPAKVDELLDDDLIAFRTEKDSEPESAPPTQPGQSAIPTIMAHMQPSAVQTEAADVVTRAGVARQTSSDSSVDEAIRQTSKATKWTTQRATVRYYDRMNPERVYPLLVLLTQAMVEKVKKKDTRQVVSGPFQVDARTAIEIEPVLPGCDCYPPKVVVHSAGKDLTATFRIVPRILGKVDGAYVSIRQNRVSLVEIALQAKVVKPTWAILSAAVTFTLPGLSTLLKHFGISFESAKDHGFNLYLATAHLLFDRLSALVLTLCLGLVTGTLWWFTRSRSRDVFWDVEKVEPWEKLKRIAALTHSDLEQATDDLLDLLHAFPDYQPARLFYAEWHYNTRNYRAAVTGYEVAFELGVTKARHYHKASSAANRLSDNVKARAFLLEADSKLPPGQMTGVMLYNLGCYHTRLGHYLDAMAALRRAFDTGYTKIESYENDEDLEPLRSRADFQALLEAVRSKCR